MVRIILLFVLIFFINSSFITNLVESCTLSFFSFAVVFFSSVVDFSNQERDRVQ